MANDNNNRETGARHLPAKADADAHDDFSQSAAENRKPKGGVGLTESVDDVNEKTRHSDGQNPTQAKHTVAGNGKGVRCRSCNC